MHCSRHPTVISGRAQPHSYRCLPRHPTPKHFISFEDENFIRTKVHDTTTELLLWLNEWSKVVSNEQVLHLRELALLNLHIQYDWALITLHLKAVSASGIENIAIMTDFQKDMIQRAKEASTRHLNHLLEVSTSPTSPSGSAPAYLNTFKWTMDYVWAKCAFSILLVLRLSVLLRDPIPHILSLLRDAHRVLEELKKVTIGYIPYFQILQTSIEKCEAAIVDYSAQQDIADPSLAVSDPLRATSRAMSRASLRSSGTSLA